MRRIRFLQISSFVIFLVLVGFTMLRFSGGLPQGDGSTVTIEQDGQNETAAVRLLAAE